MGFLIPYGEGKHAAQFFQAPRPEFLVQMDDDLGVSVCFEGVTFAQEKGAQFLVIVDFPVEDDPDAAVLIGQGLMSSVQVNDREPAVAQSDLGGGVNAFIVWTSMADSLKHRPNQSGLDVGLSIKIKLSADSAHKQSTGGRCARVSPPNGF